MVDGDVINFITGARVTQQQSTNFTTGNGVTQNRAFSFVTFNPNIVSEDYIYGGSIYGDTIIEIPDFDLVVQPFSTTTSFSPVSLVSGAIMVIEPFGVSNNFSNLTFFNTITDTIEAFNTTTDFSDVTFSNVIPFTLQPFTTATEFSTVTFEDDIDFNLIAQPFGTGVTFTQIRFEGLTSQLISARQDITQVLNEIGDIITYRAISKVFDDVGQLREQTTQDYTIKALFTQGDNKTKSNNEYGDYIGGTQNVNVGFEIQGYGLPKVKDIIIDPMGQRWEIIEVKTSRLYGGVWDNTCIIQRYDITQ